jgi:chromosome segregation ATPase
LELKECFEKTIEEKPKIDSVQQEEYQYQIQRLNSLVEEYSKRAQEAESQASEATQAKYDADTKVRAFEKALHDMEMELKRGKADAERHQDNYLNECKRNQELKNKMDRMVKEHRDELKRVTDESTQRYDDLEQKYKEKKIEEKAHKKENNKLKIEMSSLKSDLKIALDDVQHAKKLNETRSSTKEIEYDHEIQSLNSKVRNQYLQIKDLEKENGHLEGELTKYKTKLECLEQKQYNKENSSVDKVSQEPSCGKSCFKRIEDLSAKVRKLEEAKLNQEI